MRINFEDVTLNERKNRAWSYSTNEWNQCGQVLPYPLSLGTETQIPARFVSCQLEAWFGSIFYYSERIYIGWWVSNTQGSRVQDWAVIKRAKDTWQCCAGGKIHLVQFIIFGFGSWDITHIQSQNDRTNWIRGRKATENARSVGRKGPRNTQPLFCSRNKLHGPLEPNKLLILEMPMSEAFLVSYPMLNDAQFWWGYALSFHQRKVPLAPRPLFRAFSPKWGISRDLSARMCRHNLLIQVAAHELLTWERGSLRVSLTLKRGQIKTSFCRSCHITQAYSSAGKQKASDVKLGQNHWREDFTPEQDFSFQITHGSRHLFNSKSELSNQ